MRTKDKVRQLKTWCVQTEGEVFWDHDWRLIDEKKQITIGGVSWTTTRRWYCTRCRKIETTIERTEDA